MEKNEWDNAIQEWLEQHDDDDVGIPPQRYSLQDSADGMIVDDDLPREIERAKAQEFSARWGWVYDLASALYWWFRSWFTTDVMLGMFRASYGLIMAGLLAAIIYSVFYAQRHAIERRLPTIDELMKPAEPEGSTQPQEGSR